MKIKDFTYHETRFEIKTDTALISVTYPYVPQEYQELGFDRDSISRYIGHHIKRISFDETTIRIETSLDVLMFQKRDAQFQIT